MAILKSFSISLESNHSMLPLQRNDYAEFNTTFDLTTLFQRIKKATAYICVLTSNPSPDSFELYEDDDSLILRDTSNTVSDGTYYYLTFDLTGRIQNIPYNSLILFVKNNYSQNNDSVSVYPALSHLDIEYEEPFDHLNNQVLDGGRLGNSYSYSVDKYTLNTYISRRLFDGALTIDYSLVYDFVEPNNTFYSCFPKGWKLNILEKLIIDNQSPNIVLVDERYNRRIFKPSNEPTIFYDSVGSGFILEKSTDNNVVTYKLFNPAFSAYKLFNQYGRIETIALENGNQININYAQDLITITDYMGVVLTIEKESSTLTTITTNALTQEYQLTLTSNNELSTLSFYPSSSSNQTIQDTFTYNGRITGISASDNYQLSFTYSTNYLTISKSFNNNLISQIKYQYKITYNTIENLINQYKEKLYFDSDGYPIISGQDTGHINNEDAMSFIKKTFLFNSYQFNSETSVQYNFPYFNNATSCQLVSTGLYTATVITNTYDIDAGTYLLVAKIKPITNTISTVNHDTKSLILTCPNIFGTNHLLRFDSWNEQYIFYNFNISQGHNNVYFKLETAQPDATFEISNVYLITIKKKYTMLSYSTNPFTGFDGNNSFTNVESIKYTNNSQDYYLSIRDTQINQILKYKYTFVKYFFVDNLHKLFVLASNQPPAVSCDGGSNQSFANLVFAQWSWVSDCSFISSAITSSSDQWNYIVSQGKCLMGTNPFQKYYETLTYDYHGNLLSRIDSHSIVRTTNLDSSLRVESEVISHPNEYIYCECTYDNKGRLLTTSTLLGSQVVTETYAYSNQYLRFPSTLTDGNNNVINYSYSTHYEYLRTISQSATPLLSYYIHTALDDSFNVDKIESPIGDYRFEYSSQRNDLTKIYFHYNTLHIPVAPTSENDEPETRFDPIIINDYNTNLVTINTFYLGDGSFYENITYANNYSYRKEYDEYGRLFKIQDSDSLYYQWVYSSSNPKAKITLIYDDSGYETEQISFQYNKEKISSITCNSSYELGFAYSYDLYDRFSERVESFCQNHAFLSGFSKISYTYSYDNADDSINGCTIKIFKPSTSLTNPSKTLTSSITKDHLGRPSSMLTTAGIYSLGLNNFTYCSLNALHTSNQISSVQHAYTGDVDSFTYDGVGNILSVTTNNNGISYQYDSLSRLIKEEHTADNYYIEYDYDYDGNIKYAKKRSLINNSLIESNTFSYDDHMPYKLASYNGVTITYDNFLNPLTLNGNTLTYYRGNKLRTFNDGVLTTTYGYFGNGLRSYKSNSSTVTRFFYESDRLVKELRIGNNQTSVLNYLYGVNGIVGFTYGASTYLYDKNIFGDVLAIYKVGTLNSLSLQAKYVYDAYGNHQVYDANGGLNTSSTFIGNINPIRYRSYYFDVESGFYYCQSRYYVPYLRRWLTMDSLSYLDNQDILGSNLFCYCYANPIMYKDESGCSATAILFGLIIGAIIGTIVGFGTIAYIDYSNDREMFNGDVMWYDYLGASLIGGAIGGLIGAAGGYLSTLSWTLSISSFESFNGFVAMTSTSSITIAGSDILTIGSIASGLVMAATIGKSNGYRVKHYYPNDHDPAHVHIYGDDIHGSNGIRVGLDGNPLSGESPLSPGAKKAIKRLLKQILRALKPFMR